MFAIQPVLRVKDVFLSNPLQNGLSKRSLIWAVRGFATTWDLSRKLSDIVATSSLTITLTNYPDSSMRGSHWKQSSQFATTLILASNIADVTNRVIFEEGVSLEPFNVIRISQLSFNHSGIPRLYDPGCVAPAIDMFEAYVEEIPPLDAIAAQAKLTLVDSRKACSFSYSCALPPTESI